MELNRRDALTVLGGLGLTATGWLASSVTDDTDLSPEDINALVALAETLYPSTIQTNAEFVRTYIGGQHQLEPNHTSGIVDSLKLLRQESQRQMGRQITDLTPSERGEVLRATGADRAQPDPHGSDVERIRYYVINNLLYALYTTPKGGELVGNRNPPGHPGGIEAYQEEPPDG